MPTPPQADTYYARQARLSALAAIRAAGAWNSGQVAGLTATVAVLQYTAAAEADPYLDTFDRLTAGAVAPEAYVGVAGDGRELVTLWTQAATRAALQVMAATAVQDAARGAVTAGIGSRRRLTGYVRMLVAPSCSRCAVLAGRWYGWNTGFQRHPRCDCRHIPAREDDHDLRTDPEVYFRSLNTADQDRIFTRAGAQAIRDGADIGQVVNARDGMQTAQIGGRDVLLTTDGTSTRSAYGRSVADRGTTKTPGGRDRTVNRPRVMPETIYEIAGDDRDEAIRLLKANGFLT